MFLHKNTISTAKSFDFSSIILSAILCSIYCVIFLGKPKSEIKFAISLQQEFHLAQPNFTAA